MFPTHQPLFQKSKLVEAVIYFLCPEWKRNWIFRSAKIVFYWSNLSLYWLFQNGIFRKQFVVNHSKLIAIVAFTLLSPHEQLLLDISEDPYRRFLFCLRPLIHLFYNFPLSKLASWTNHWSWIFITYSLSSDINTLTRALSLHWIWSSSVNEWCALCPVVERLRCFHIGLACFLSLRTPGIWTLTSSFKSYDLGSQLW